MVIRDYQSADCRELAQLFYDTVHAVNAADYTDEQLNAWAPERTDPERWDQSLREHICVVALLNETIVGFGDIDAAGYLDHLFVHKDHQGKGIATAICDRLEQGVTGRILTHASITAKPFFEKRGYRVVRKQQVERHGVFLTNYVMEKKR